MRADRLEDGGAICRIYGEGGEGGERPIFGLGYQCRSLRYEGEAENRTTTSGVEQERGKTVLTTAA